MEQVTVAQGVPALQKGRRASDQPPKQLGQREDRFLAWIAVLAALGGFLFGFDTGVVGSACGNDQAAPVGASNIGRLGPGQ